MNALFNAYPNVRWTTPKQASSHSERVPGCRLVSSRPTETASAPLRELFWSDPDFTLSEDARQRIEKAIAAVLLREGESQPIQAEEMLA